MKNTKKKKRWQWNRKLWMFVCFAVGRNPNDKDYFVDNGPNYESNAWDDWCKRASEMGWLRDKDEEEYKVDAENQLREQECEYAVEWDTIVTSN